MKGRGGQIRLGLPTRPNRCRRLNHRDSGRSQQLSVLASLWWIGTQRLAGRAWGTRRALPDWLATLLQGKWAHEDSNLGPTGYASHLQLSLPLSGLWAGLSLHPTYRLRRAGACRLVSTPSPVRRSLARDYPTYSTGLGFPEFDRYHLRISPQAAH